MLPKINLPIYDIVLPVIEKRIRIRPFTVKENKILMMAIETGDENQIITSTKQIVNNCIVTEGIDIDKLAYYQIEFILLNIRAASISEILTLNFMGIENSECPTCKEPKTVKINLNDVKVSASELHNPKIKLDCGLTIMMKEPTYDIMANLKKQSLTLEGIQASNMVDFVGSCIESISDEENVYVVDEISKSELTEFIESIPINDFKKIEKFFETIPRLKHRIDMKCPTCSFEQYYELEGIHSFLD
jgi:hypothetical protein